MPPRCCDQPQPVAYRGWGPDEAATITIVCTRCETEIVALRPPEAMTVSEAQRYGRNVGRLSVTQERTPPVDPVVVPFRRSVAHV